MTRKLVRCRCAALAKLLETGKRQDIPRPYCLNSTANGSAGHERVEAGQQRGLAHLPWESFLIRSKPAVQTTQGTRSQVRK